MRDPHQHAKGAMLFALMTSALETMRKAFSAPVNQGHHHSKTRTPGKARQSEMHVIGYKWLKRTPEWRGL